MGKVVIHLGKMWVIAVALWCYTLDGSASTGIEKKTISVLLGETIFNPGEVILMNCEKVREITTWTG